MEKVHRPQMTDSACLELWTIMNQAVHSANFNSAYLRAMSVRSSWWSRMCILPPWRDYPDPRTCRWGRACSRNRLGACSPLARSASSAAPRGENMRARSVSLLEIKTSTALTNGELERHVTCWANVRKLAPPVDLSPHWNRNGNVRLRVLEPDQVHPWGSWGQSWKYNHFATPFPEASVKYKFYTRIRQAVISCLLHTLNFLQNISLARET